MPNVSKGKAMPQEFEQIRSADQPLDGEESAPVAGARTDDTLDALDAVLDDIESVLETNAEEYVGSFVQKGGE
ncbi:ubiquitin-like protein Pup [Bifidobacterium dentium]|jgi:ubiquitin-like protein Pup|uniref:Prokaryotic ubiquitin-like protein Pup n=2 Tax=Bifidobacterium dentium TaxID=1689 RepID=A0A7J5TF21_9BIFI|nr:ubiquitin-like protein Pup [Bifidobacterium dentium]KAB7461373.1 ubiquitin-like protein Pup [Bifidobacterium dentium]KAB7465896.1 ubiquitin-like protein Pup [Bifidobacterium dentium]RYT66442.1 ubiquitin-like protein Pup [Bifidobacterium dentium]